jgi:hypothetical protein
MTLNAFLCSALGITPRAHCPVPTAVHQKTEGQAPPKQVQLLPFSALSSLNDAVQYYGINYAKIYLQSLLPLAPAPFCRKIWRHDQPIAQNDIILGNAIGRWPA